MIPSLARLTLAASPSGDAQAVPEIGEKRKLARTVATGLVLPPRPMTGLASLDANGVTTFMLTFDAKGIATRLRECSNVWFHHNFRLMLTNGHKTLLKHSEMRDDKVLWDTLSAEAQRAYVERIDLRTDEGMRLAFDSKYIKNDGLVADDARQWLLSRGDLVRENG